MNDKIAEMEMIIDELQDELRQAESLIARLDLEIESKTSKEFYTVIELAKYLNVNPNTIHKMKKRGDLPYYKIGRATRFKIDDAKKYLEKQRKD